MVMQVISWLKLGRNSRQLVEKEMKEIDTSDALLRKEWDTLFQEVAIIERALDAEQDTYNMFVKNMKFLKSQQKCFETFLHGFKEDISSCLSEPHMDVENFKTISEQLIETQYGYDVLSYRLYEMEQEFNKHYHSWDSKTENKNQKLNVMQERMKYILHSLKEHKI